MFMNGEQVSIWKDAALAYFTVLSWHSLGVTKENQTKNQFGKLLS